MQSYLSAYHWILFFLLLTSISPNSYGNVHESAHYFVPNPLPNRTHILISITPFLFNHASTHSPKPSYSIYPLCRSAQAENPSTA